MHVAARGTLVLLVLAGLLAPTTQATLVPAYDFSARFEVAQGLGNETADTRLGILTGTTNVEGNGTGLYAFVGSTAAALRNLTRVEVYDKEESESTAIDRVIRTGSPALMTIADANMTFLEGASFLFYTNVTAVNYTLGSPFALSLPILPPTEIGNVTAFSSEAASLAVAGKGSFHGLFNGTTHSGVLNPSSDPILYPLRANARIQIEGRTGTSPASQEYTFQGSNYIYLLEGAFTMEVTTEVALVPFPNGSAASLGPAPVAAAQDGFNLTRFSSAFTEFGAQEEGGGNGGNNSFLDPQAEEILRGFSPIFNGAILGNPRGNLTIAGKAVPLGNFTFLRFERLDVRAGDGANLSYEGRGRFLLANDQLYTEKSTMDLGFFRLPALSVILWIIAVAAVVATFVLKPFMQAGKMGFLVGMPIKLIAILVHLLALVITFLLWDGEVKAFLGTSLLSALGGGGSGLSLLPIALLQIVSFSLALFFFGAPIGLILSSVLKLIGLKPAKGVAKGIGNLSGWLLGAAFLPVFFNPFVGAIVDALAGAF